MVTLQSADNALKDVYLGVIANQLNVGVNPFLAKIKRTTSDVWGKNIVKLAPYGVNGGVSATTEEGKLPQSGANNYLKFVTDLKNLYGKIELSDKAIRASQNSAGAFVNLLNDEMESLIKASTFNFGRMLFGDGTGKLASITSVTKKVCVVDKVNFVIEGMIVDVYDSDGTKVGSARITGVDRVNKKITLDTELTSSKFAGGYITNQDSLNNELTGLGAIFTDTGYIYGLDKSKYDFLKPQVKSSFGVLSDTKIQEVLDNIEQNHGEGANYIACSYDVRRYYQAYMETYKRNVDVINLEGGFKAISINGIPMIADRFVEDGTMLLLNTNDFAMHELCDWQWITTDDGKILHQNPGYATYSASLVKYADMICSRPGAQAKITGITAQAS